MPSQSEVWGISYLVKHVLELVLSKGTALDVLNRAQLLRHPLSILLPHWLHFLLGKLVPHTAIVSQIDLCSDYEARNPRAVVMDFGEPFLPYVLEGGWRCDTEANQEDVCLWVRQGPQSIVIFLSGGIEQSKSIWLITDPKR